jgi:hypothetical protein
MLALCSARLSLPCQSNKVQHKPRFVYANNLQQDEQRQAALPLSKRPLFIFLSTDTLLYPSFSPEVIQLPGRSQDTRQSTFHKDHVAECWHLQH